MFISYSTRSSFSLVSDFFQFYSLYSLSLLSLNGAISIIASFGSIYKWMYKPYHSTSSFIASIFVISTPLHCEALYIYFSSIPLCLFSSIKKY